MNNKLYEFLKGRNGADQLAKTSMYISILFLIINFFVKSTIISIISLLVVLYANYRVFSKDIKKRVEENQKFLKKVNPMIVPLVKLKNRTFGKEGYKYFDCSNCKQELRVPKGKGKLKVKCPKCGELQEIKS